MDHDFCFCYDKHCDGLHSQNGNSKLEFAILHRQVSIALLWGFVQVTSEIWTKKRTRVKSLGPPTKLPPNLNFTYDTFLSHACESFECEKKFSLNHRFVTFSSDHLPQLAHHRHAEHWEPFVTSWKLYLIHSTWASCIHSLHSTHLSNRKNIVHQYLEKL